MKMKTLGMRPVKSEGTEMGYVLRVRLASFFTGAALASAAGLYYLQKDYAIAHHAISQQVFLFALSSAILLKLIVTIILIAACS